MGFWNNVEISIFVLKKYLIVSSWRSLKSETEPWRFRWWRRQHVLNYDLVSLWGAICGRSIVWSCICIETSHFLWDWLRHTLYMHVLNFECPYVVCCKAFYISFPIQLTLASFSIGSPDFRFIPVVLLKIHFQEGFNNNFSSP